MEEWSIQQTVWHIQHERKTLRHSLSFDDKVVYGKEGKLSDAVVLKI